MTLWIVFLMILGGAIDGVCLPDYVWLRSFFAVVPCREEVLDAAGEADPEELAAIQAMGDAPARDEESPNYQLVRFLSRILPRRQRLLDDVRKADGQQVARQPGSREPKGGSLWWR